MVFTIGLTGGIGSGKTTVANLFANYGIDIIDTDTIAREMVAPNSTALEHIIGHFGAAFLNKDGTLNRRLLAEQVFADANAKQWLDRLLHPLIRAEMKQQIQQSQSPYCIAVVPLLVENQLQTMFDRILVIDCDQDLQLSRTRQRDQRSKACIDAIIHSQATRTNRLTHADDIIINNGDLATLKQHVNQYHQHYLSLCQPTAR